MITKDWYYGLAQSLFMSQKIGDHMYLPSTKWMIFTRKLVNIMDAGLDLPTNQLSQLSPIWVDLGQIDCDLNPKLHHGFWFFSIFLWIYLHNKVALWLSPDEIKSNCIIVFLASLFWSSDLWRSKGQKEGQEWMLCYATQSTKYFTPHWKFRKTNNR